MRQLRPILKLPRVDSSDLAASMHILGVRLYLRRHRVSLRRPSLRHRALGLRRVALGLTVPDGGLPIGTHHVCDGDVSLLISRDLRQVVFGALVLHKSRRRGDLVLLIGLAFCRVG